MFAPSMLLVYAGLLMFLAFAFIASVASAVLLFRRMRKPSNQNPAAVATSPVVDKPGVTNLLDGIDFSDGISDAELELIRSRALEAANQQFQNMAVKKIRALLQ